MKIRYIGQSFGVDGLTSDKVYECLRIEWPFLRVIDDSQEDYLYSATDPGPLDGETPTGKWEVVEDDSQELLSKAIKGVFE